MILRRCYKATVNESETITEAQLCSVRSRSEVSEFRAFGRRFPAVPHIERS
jgi:hypothetical protein